MIINESVVNKIIEIISPLIHDEFGQIEEDDDYSFDDAYWIQKKLAEHGIDAEVLNGVSKCAILCPDMGDVVLKIPFNGWYHMDMDTGELIWYPFEGSEDATHCDYCATEYCKYKELTSKGLECFVAETIVYKTSKNSHSFYLQEYVTPFYFDEDVHPTSPQTKEIVETLEVNTEMLDSEWLANCVEYYGRKRVEDFFNYCEIDTTILSDTHCGNFGYRKDGTPALLDFSGWYDY